MTFTPSRDAVTGVEGAPPPHCIWREGCDAGEKEWPVFEDEGAAWYGPFGQIVGQLDPETEADPVAVGFDLLISFGNIIGPSAHMNVGGAHHDGRLFGVIVGNSSKARKGTSQRLVMSILRHLDPEWYRHRQLRGIASGEALIDFAAGKIQRADENYMDPLKRTMIREDELARLLAASGREGSTLGSVMRDAWEQDQLSTVSRTATSMVEGAHISMSAHITAFELEQRLSTTDIFNGFANRCIWLVAKRSKLLPSGGNLTDEDFKLFAEALRRPVKLASNLGRMKRTAKAEALWRDLYKGPLSADEPGVVGVLTARAEPQVIRLALLFALLDAESFIDVRHIEQAYQWWSLSTKSVAYLFGSPDDGLSADERKLLGALRKAGCAGLTASEQLVKAFSRHRTAEQIRGFREHLMARGLIWSAFTPGEGTKPILTTWALVPGTQGGVVMSPKKCRTVRTTLRTCATFAPLLRGCADPKCRKCRKFAPLTARARNENTDSKCRCSSRPLNDFQSISTVERVLRSTSQALGNENDYLTLCGWFSHTGRPSPAGRRTCDICDICTPSTDRRRP